MYATSPAQTSLGALGSCRAHRQRHEQARVDWRRGRLGWSAHHGVSGSKTALNALTAHYARDLASTAIKVNGAAPGHVATDFNNFRGTALRHTALQSP
jgi:NAD(P)-dependent dehydrogenase (short-subunit alcohol dehydrogenase family)